MDYDTQTHIVNEDDTTDPEEDMDQGIVDEDDENEDAETESEKF